MFASKTKKSEKVTLLNLKHISNTSESKSRHFIYMNINRSKLIVSKLIPNITSAYNRTTSLSKMSSPPELVRKVKTESKTADIDIEDIPTFDPTQSCEKVTKKRGKKRPTIHTFKYDDADTLFLRYLMKDELLIKSALDVHISKLHEKFTAQMASAMKDLALTTLITCGKYKGQSISEVADKDMPYLLWIAFRSGGYGFKTEKPIILDYLKYHSVEPIMTLTPRRTRKRTKID